jgi:murein DD-endopeptidase MepM/ murein hydrolase activator NlpD
MRRLPLLTLLTAVLVLAPAGSVARAGPPGWEWPLPAPHVVVGVFDPPAEPWLAGHRGVDLRGHVREPVLAAGDGVVAFAGRVGGVPVVSVRHPDGLLTTYQPVTATVEAGDGVRAGQRIGRLTAAGSHCAPAACLHWGLRRGPDDYLDPLLLVAATRVRLVPLYGGGPGPTLPLGATTAGTAGVVALALRRRGRRLS